MKRFCFLVWNTGGFRSAQSFAGIGTLCAWLQRHPDVNGLLLTECIYEFSTKLLESLQAIDPHWKLITKGEPDFIALENDEPKFSENAVRVFFRADPQLNIREIPVDKDYGTFLSELDTTLNDRKLIRASNFYERREFYLNRMRWLMLMDENKPLTIGVGVHLFSKNDEYQAYHNETLIKIIEIIKDYLYEENTPLFFAGDFNYNPYESEVYRNHIPGDRATRDPQNPLYIDGGKFLVVPTRKAFFAKRQQNKFVNYLYNPMWMLLGDQSDESVIEHDNTQRYSLSYNYFHTNPKNDHERFFNLLDGLLMNEHLIRYFNDKRFGIAEDFLALSDIHNSTGLGFHKDLDSDHLPLIFELDFDR